MCPLVYGFLATRVIEFIQYAAGYRYHWPNIPNLAFLKPEYEVHYYRRRLGRSLL